MRSIRAPLAILLAWLTACGDDDAATPDAGVADAAGTADAASPDAAEDPRFAPLVEAIEAELDAVGAPGVAVAVLQGGEVVFARGFGVKAPGGSDPILPTTLFRIGSTNKMITAAALLQQVEAGTVDLDAPVVDYLPAFHLDGDAAWAPSLRVRQLLEHTSGLADYLEVDAPAGEQDDAALAAFLTGRYAGIGYLAAPAGTFYNYSNPGYMLAGLVAEEASGSAYRALLHDRVFAPLGMTRTFFLGAEVLADGDYAFGATQAPGWAPAVGPESYDNPWARPAGYAWSSVLDLARFARFLLAGDPAVLADPQRVAMQSAQRSTQQAGEHEAYGFGLMRFDGFFLIDGTWTAAAFARILTPSGATSTYHDVPVVLHDGAIPGYSAWLSIVPSLDVAFITLANGDGAYFAHSFGVALSTLAELPAPAPPPDDLEPDPATFGAFAGTYVDPYVFGTIEISVADGQVGIVMPALDAAMYSYSPTLLPATPGNFLLQVEGTWIVVTFIAGEGGAITYFRTRYGVGVRTPGVRGAAVAPDPEALRRALAAPRLGYPTETFLTPFLGKSSRSRSR